MQADSIGSLAHGANLPLHRRKRPDIFEIPALVSVMQAADGDVRLEVLLRSEPSSRRQTLLLASWLQGEMAALTAAAGGWPIQRMSRT